MSSAARETTALSVASSTEVSEPERQDLTSRADGPPPGVQRAPKRRSLTATVARRFFQVLLPILVIAAGLAAYQYLKSTKPQVAKRTPRPTVFNVQTMPVTFAAHTPKLQLFGTTVAARELEIRSLVAGTILKTNDQLREGGELNAGDTIIEIDPFDYKAALADTRNQLLESKARLREMRASLVVEQGNLRFSREQLVIATRDLERAQPLSVSGAVSKRTVDDRRTTFVQRRQAVQQSENNIQVWQARIAQQEATIERFKTSLLRAQRRVAETKLKVPFNAYVSDVSAQVGRIVSVNDRIATLIDKDRIDVLFTLTDQQFGRILRSDEGVVGRELVVSWNVGRKPIQFRARIVSVSAKVSAEAGGVQVYARIVDAAKGVGLRPGAFVEIAVPDVPYKNVARLPGTAVYDSRKLYIVQDGKLVERKIEIVGAAESDLLVRGEIKSGDKIMITRLSTPGPGVRVRERSSNGS